MINFAIDVLLNEETVKDQDKFKTWFIKAYMKQFGFPPDISTNDVIGSLQDREKKIKEYFSEVLRCVSISLYKEDISIKVFEKTRVEEVCTMRKIVCYIMVQRLKFSKSSVGRLIGKDHSTVVYYCRKVDDFMSFDKEFRKKMERVVKMLIDNGIVVH